MYVNKNIYYLEQKNFKKDIFSLGNDVLATQLNMQLLPVLNVSKSVNISPFSRLSNADGFFKERWSVILICSGT